jgi:GTP cyclohydrolase III
MSDEYVEVTWGGETFTPISYHTFKVGPFTMRTKVQHGETPEQAMMRAWTALNNVARSTFQKEKAEFLNRAGEVAREARQQTKG